MQILNAPLKALFGAFTKVEIWFCRITMFPRRVKVFKPTKQRNQKRNDRDANKKYV